MSTSYEATGRIVKIYPTQEVGAKGFKKRDVIIQPDPESKYPQEVPFTFTKDKCDEVDALAVGQEITVHFNLRGNYWEKGDRHFGSSEVWRFEALDTVVPSPLDEEQPAETGGEDGEQWAF